MRGSLGTPVAAFAANYDGSEVSYDLKWPMLLHGLARDSDHSRPHGSSIPWL